MKKAFLLGHPVAHSLSPRLHGFWIQQQNIQASYEAIDVSPEDLIDKIQQLQADGYAGGNVTIPHKEAVYEFIKSHGQLTNKAKQVQAVNTIYFDGNIIHGDNTDIYGFYNNLEANTNWAGKKAVILGAGGAAKAVIQAVIDKGYTDIVICNRNINRAQELAVNYDNVIVKDWDERSNILKNTDLLVNTTSLGMLGKPELEIDLSTLPNSAAVTDIVYNPLQTNLLKQAQECGNKTVDGIGMLLHQAVPGFKYWFDKDVEVSKSLRDYILQ